MELAAAARPRRFVESYDSHWVSDIDLTLHKITTGRLIGDVHAVSRRGIATGEVDNKDE